MKILKAAGVRKYFNHLWLEEEEIRKPKKKVNHFRKKKKKKKRFAIPKDIEKSRKKITRTSSFMNTHTYISPNHRSIHK